MRTITGTRCRYDIRYVPSRCKYDSGSQHSSTWYDCTVLLLKIAGQVACIQVEAAVCFQAEKEIMAALPMITKN